MITIVSVEVFVFVWLSFGIAQCCGENSMECYRSSRKQNNKYEFFYHRFLCQKGRFRFLDELFACIKTMRRGNQERTRECRYQPITMRQWIPNTKIRFFSRLSVCTVWPWIFLALVELEFNEKTKNIYRLSWVSKETGNKRNKSNSSLSSSIDRPWWQNLCQPL